MVGLAVAAALVAGAVFCFGGVVWADGFGAGLLTGGGGVSWVGGTCGGVDVGLGGFGWAWLDDLGGCCLDTGLLIVVEDFDVSGVET